jgi:HK97 family phage portal protein
LTIFRQIGLWLTGSMSRQKGLQSGAPALRSAESAMPVTPDTALAHSAVWACVRLISESIASLPICIYKKDPATGIRTPAPDHPLAMLFNAKPNRWQTRQEYFETITFQMALRGNNFSLIQRGTKGQIVGLIPLMTDQMDVQLMPDGSLLYRYLEGGQLVPYTEDQIWHNKLFGNGVIGLSPLDFARNAIGIGQAAEKAVTKIYRNGGKPSGALTLDQVLNPKQREEVRANFKELTEGEDNRLFLLEAGAKFSQISLSPQDIELLASRRFQIEDIARFFGTPSVLINDASSTTAWGSGIQQIMQGFYKLGLRPYITRYQDSIRNRLMTPQERQNIDVEFDFNALLRPDLAERIKMGKDAVQGGLYTPNEWRAGEGEPPKPGGDDLLVQRQMVALPKLGDIKGPQGGPPNGNQ